MNILIVGSQRNQEESVRKFGDVHHYELVGNHQEAKENLNSYDLILDFLVDKNPDGAKIYRNHNGKIFFSTGKITLAAIMDASGIYERGKFAGFNGMAGFLLNTSLEVSLFEKEDEHFLSEFLGSMNISYAVVSDRVGMVTPRIICMIINEAYYTVEEKTATREDIDLAMKLGTNYPYGPFEWCARIGIKEVYELLAAIHSDTNDDCYKICPLLEREYLQASITKD